MKVAMIALLCMVACGCSSDFDQDGEVYARVSRAKNEPCKIVVSTESTTLIAVVEGCKP